MGKRVLVAGFKHETNTFSRQLADLAAYRARALFRGPQVAARLADTRTEVGAFVP